MKAYDPSDLELLARGRGYAAFDVTDVNNYYVTITLSSDSPELWQDVTVEAGFTCVEAGQASHGYFEYLRREQCEGRSF